MEFSMCFTMNGILNVFYNALLSYGMRKKEQLKHSLPAQLANQYSCFPVDYSVDRGSRTPCLEPVL